MLKTKYRVISVNKYIKIYVILSDCQTVINKRKMILEIPCAREFACPYHYPFMLLLFIRMKIEVVTMLATSHS